MIAKILIDQYNINYKYVPMLNKRNQTFLKKYHITAYM